MQNNNDYNFREWLGRTAFKDLQLKGLLPKKWELKFTADYYSYYDSYFQLGNKNVFVEIKVRDKTYGDYVLERNKCKNLNSVYTNLYLRQDEVKFLYVNFCVEGTYLWDIDNYVFNYDKIKWGNKEMNKATSSSRTDKVDKSCVMLKPSDGKTIDYKINKNQLIKEEEERLHPKPTPKPGIFD